VKFRALLLGLLLVLPITVAQADGYHAFDGTNDTWTATLTTTRADPLSVYMQTYMTTHPVAVKYAFVMGNSNSSNNDSYACRTGATANEWIAASLNSVGGLSQASAIDTNEAAWVPAICEFISDTSRDLFYSEQTDANGGNRAVADVIQYIRLGENMAAGNDFTGRLAYPTIWNVQISDATEAALLAGNCPLKYEGANIIAHWSFQDNSGTATNVGSDAGGDLTRSGSNGFSSTGGPGIDCTPLYTAGPTAATITSTTYQHTYTPDQNGISYIAFCPNGQTIGTGADVEAGTCSGGAAVSTANDASLATVGDSITASGLSAGVTYDAYMVHKAFEAYSAVQSLPDRTTTGGTVTITDVDTDESLTATQANFTITGTGFGASQGGGGVTLRQGGNTKTISGCSWSDTSLTLCDMSGVGAGVANGLLYGTMEIRVTNNAAAFDDQEIQATVPSGTLYYTLTSLLDLVFEDDGYPIRLYGDPLDLETTSQVAVQNAAGCSISGVVVNADGSAVFNEACTSFDWDFSRGGLYVGTLGDISVSPCRPVFGNTPFPDLLFQEDIAIVSLDVDIFFQSCEEAITVHSLQGLSATTDSTTDVNGAVTDSQIITVDDASVLLDDVGKYVQCASGEPARLVWANPLTNQIRINDPRTWADNCQVDLRTASPTTIPGLTLDSATGVLSGTPSTSAVSSPVIFRAQTASSVNTDAP